MRRQKPHDHLNRCRKSISQNLTSVHDKKKKKTPLTKVGTEGTYLNILKATYDKPTANTTLSGESLPTKIQNKTRMSTFTSSMQLSIGCPSFGNQTRNKGIQMKGIGKIVIICRCHDIIYINRKP